MQTSTLRNWLIILVVAGLALALGAGAAALVYQYQVIPGMAAQRKQGGQAGAGPSGPPPARVRVASVGQQRLRKRFEVIGRLREVQRATVAAEVTGKLRRVPVEEGETVKGGQTTLAVVDDVWQDLDLKAAKAEAAAARATLKQNQLDLNELEQLLNKNAATQQEVAEKRAQVESDKARLQAAQARGQQAQERVNRLTVIAPFDGVITNKMAEVGEWVQPGAAVVEMISRGRIDAVLNVPENYINTIEPGMEVTVRIDPLRRRVTGEVVTIQPVGDNPARTFPVEVRMDDTVRLGQGAGGSADGGRTVRLKPGMSVTGHLPVAAEAERLTVPRAALSFGPRGAAIWLADGGANQSSGGEARPRPDGGDPSAQASPGGKPAPGQGGKPSGGRKGQRPPMPTAKRVDVEVLFGTDQGYAIQPADGVSNVTLNPGQKVVIEGWERLSAGQPLIVVGTGPPRTDPGHPRRTRQASREGG